MLELNANVGINSNRDRNIISFTSLLVFGHKPQKWTNVDQMMVK